ncbi:MAG: hypothetical protein ACH37H_01145 [Ilumatobacteraceae bacterium]
MQVFGGTVGRAWRAVATGGDTPTRLRTWMVGSVVVAVLFGVLGAVGVGRRDSALGDGDAASQQLIAVQDVQVRLVHADSIARENYLRGGIEDAAKRATYETELAAVSDGLVAVGNRVLPDDAAMLAAVSAQLTRYSGLIEQARANNRQGFPVGAAYLRTANDLATTMVASLRDVQSSLRSQVNDNLDGADTAGLWLHLTGWPLLVLLLTGGGWVAFRFRRLLNVPLAVAAGVTLLLLVIGGSMQGSAMSDAENATGSSLQAADLAAQARSAAFEAHAQESSTLIARGSGGLDLAWQASAATAASALARMCIITGDCTLVGTFGSYAEAHDAVRASDDAGDWDGARAASLDGEAAIAFAAFDEASSAAAASLGAEAASAMSSAADGLAVLRVVLFLAGLSVAALVLVGYGQRLREYR